ncbi:hypothetical protein ACIPZ5_17840 [Pseudomonas sp. NPDC089428]|uniref:hypothetical protein n=1 Tax=Pseudomonas sp. NPDC089428 TaxID=3364467 RepID=UPI0038066444
MKVEEFRKAMDDDEGFKKKRRNLLFLSLVLLVIEVTGAKVTEASGLIFKIEFTNHERLQWFLIAGIVYGMLRYYAYSEVYRVQLYKQWASKLINDYKIYYYNYHDEEVEGLLGKAVLVWGGDEPGLAEPEYTMAGLFKRVIAYPAKDQHPEIGEVYYTKYVDLMSFSDKWTRKDFLLLLWFEMKFRIDAWISHRETLDIVTPYLAAVGALGVFFYKKFI